MLWIRNEMAIEPLIEWMGEWVCALKSNMYFASVFVLLAAITVAFAVERKFIFGLHGTYQFSMTHTSLHWIILVSYHLFWCSDNGSGIRRIVTILLMVGMDSNASHRKQRDTYATWDILSVCALLLIQNELTNEKWSVSLDCARVATATATANELLFAHWNASHRIFPKSVCCEVFTISSHVSVERFKHTFQFFSDCSHWIWMNCVKKKILWEV